MIVIMKIIIKLKIKNLKKIKDKENNNKELIYRQINVLK